MNKIILITLFALNGLLAACQKDDDNKGNNTNQYGNGPKTNTPAALQGNWMYGNFSMTEYWTQNPSQYLGNGFEMAIAFKFYPNGNYEQYFTSKTANLGVVTYHQSLTKGTVEMNEANKTITTHANYVHYKQTKNGQIIEDRDLNTNEITKLSNYTYETGTEANGTKALHLKMQGTNSALPFLQRF